jgi:hypothetical protein
MGTHITTKLFIEWSMNAWLDFCLTWQLSAFALRNKARSSAAALAATSTSDPWNEMKKLKLHADLQHA